MGKEKKRGHYKGPLVELEWRGGVGEGGAVKWNKDISIEGLLDGSYDEEDNQCRSDNETGGRAWERTLVRTGTTKRRHHKMWKKDQVKTMKCQKTRQTGSTGKEWRSTVMRYSECLEQRQSASLHRSTAKIWRRVPQPVHEGDVGKGMVPKDQSWWLEKWVKEAEGRWCSWEMHTRRLKQRENATEVRKAPTLAGRGEHHDWAHLDLLGRWVVPYSCCTWWDSPQPFPPASSRQGS